MKIVKILGGLGNQMFQYALYLALKEKFPIETIKVDLSCFNGYPLHNGFELDRIFHLDYGRASFKDLLRLAYPYSHYRLWQVGKYIFPIRKTMCVEKSDFSIDETVLSYAGDRYFDGYWQHEEYFKFAKDKIIHAFTFPELSDEKNKYVLSCMKSANSVSIHVRRGDYLNNPLFDNICDIVYYKKSIDFLQQNVNPDLYCIFSNDIEWCRLNLESVIPKDKIVYVTWNKGNSSYIDMQLMANCKHNIIANSSFSWWGAWLNGNPNKIVLTPKRWMNKSLSKDPIPATWIKIDAPF